jgi:hypothetical protein
MSPVFDVRARPIQTEVLWMFTGSDHAKPMRSFWSSTQRIYQELNQSSIAVLHWFYLVTATCFDPYLDQAVFLNMSLVTELY